MASNGSSRTPFDDDLVSDPGAPKDTQQLPTQSSGGAQPIRPSRLLPPQAGSAPTPYAGVTPNMPPVATSAPPLGPAPTPPNDTSQLSLKRTPTSTIVGLSMAGGAVAVLLISMVVRGVVHRSLSVATAPTPVTASGMAQPTPLNAELMPTPGPVEAHNPPATDAARPADIAPAPDAPGVASTTTSHSPAPRPGSRRSVGPLTPEASTSRDDTTDEAAAKQEKDPALAIPAEPKPTPDSQDAATTATGDDTVSQPYKHRRAGYVITPPAGFKLVKRGQRTVWEGPDGVTLLVETTARPGRSPFGDWLRLDGRLRQKYGQHYRSHGIDNTTVAGQPAAIWDFEIDTKSGTVRKIDVGVHSNGRGYAILGSAPLLKFDAAHSQLESAIRSFDLTHPTSSRVTHRRRSTHQNADAIDDGASDKTSNAAISNNDDLRPDAGY